MASPWPAHGKRKKDCDGFTSVQGQVKKPRFQSSTGGTFSRSSQAGQGSRQVQSLGSNVPLEVSVLKFAESRAKELEALSRAVEHVGGTKLSFQRLPRHMRRRAMSHDIRRIPQRLRLMAQAELEKRDKKGASKRPSRRHRRRPSNLMSEYQRRLRRNAWLETHIWHAKRFKMTTAWGYRLPVHPSDKSLRACYRATAHHCLLQDVSYECCIEMHGYVQVLLDALGHVTSKDIGLTFASKVLSSGQRWGSAVLYECDAYPWGAIAPVTGLWKAETDKMGNGLKVKEKETAEKRTLWLWCHPAAYSQVWTQLVSACALADGATLAEDGKRGTEKAEQQSVSPPGGTTLLVGQVHLHSLKDQLIKFHLTGPASSLILSQTLTPACVDSGAEGSPSSKLDSNGREKIGYPAWWQNFYAAEERKGQLAEQQRVWERVGKCQSPAELPPCAVLALTVRDPRVLLPSVRTKAALHEAEPAVQVITRDDLPLTTSVSPLWDEWVRNEVTTTKITEQEMNKRRSELLVPGSILQLGAEESRIPVILMQRSGTHGGRAGSAPAGVDAGWDLVAPKGWGMAFWVAMVYRGARVGGLREAHSLSARGGMIHFPHEFPDSSAGQQQQQETREQLVEVYVRRPPAKRVNYQRYGVPSPFHCPWAQLVAEWQDKVEQLLNVGKEGRKPLIFSCRKKESGQSLKKTSAANGSELANKSNGSCEGKAEGCVVDQSQLASCGDWAKSGASSTGFFVLRCRYLQRKLHERLSKLHVSVTGIASRDRSGKKTQNEAETKLSALLKQSGVKEAVSENCRSLVPVTVLCLHRGVPERLAMICLPSAADLETLAKDSTFSGPEEGLHHCQKSAAERKVKKRKRKQITAASASTSQAVCEDKQALKKGQTSKDSKKSLNPKQMQEKCDLMKETDEVVAVTDRPILGFLTNGHFDLGQGHGSGVGFCSLIGLLAAMDTVHEGKPLLVLLRSPKSCQYRFAYIFA